ncbi:MAG: response regulator [Gaiellales bacterium]|nr:MAG: response regulator [Gaiellales bacterium]
MKSLAGRISRLGIRTKMLLATVSMVMVVGLLMVALVEAITSSYVTRELDEWGASAATNLANNAVEPLLTGNVMEAHHLVENTVRTYDDIAYAFVEDEGGEVVAHSFSGDFPRDLSRINQPGPDEESSVRLLDTEVGLIRDIAVPVQEGRAGFVHVGVSEDFLYQQIADTRNRLILVVLLLSAGGAGMVLLFGHMAMKPLKVLAGKARRVGAGELDVVVPVRTRDEIGVLAQSFNEMAGALKDKIGEISEAREKYKSLVKNVPGVVYTIAADSGVPLYVSPKWTELTGYEVDNSPEIWYKPVHPDDREAARREFKEALAGGGEYALEFRIVHRETGEVRYVSNSGTPVTGDDNSLLCYDGIITDITERRSVEQQLLQSQKLESIGQLAGGVAHDLNNYLMAVQGYTELTMIGMDRESEEHRNLAEARKSIGRATELTRKLLLFGRRSEVDLRPTDINAVLSGLSGMLGRLIGERYRLTCDSRGNALIVNGDTGLLEQVIVNLVINARDAMPDGGEIGISASLADVDQQLLRTKAAGSSTGPGAYACITVTDSGVGIETEELSRIFEPFFTTKPVGQGTGLGLSVIYSIVEQHGGWIGVDSTCGRGTSISVYLPALERPAEAELFREAGGSRGRGRGEQILVVEDEEAVRQLLENVLQSNGYKAVAAAGAHEAHDIFSRNGNGVRLIISDVVLPDGNGVSLVNELVDGRSGIGVVLLSGYTADLVDRKQIEARGFDFLQKPFKLDELLETIDGALGGKGKS